MVKVVRDAWVVCHANREYEVWIYPRRLKDFIVIAKQIKRVYLMSLDWL
jgi:hypothetical protein